MGLRTFLPLLVACTAGPEPKGGDTDAHTQVTDSGDSGDTGDSGDSGDTGSVVPTGVPATLRLVAPPPACDAPNDRTSLGWWEASPRTAAPGDASNPRNLVGGALALDDLDGDGHLDLIVLDRLGTGVHLGDGLGGLVLAPDWTRELDLDDATSGALTDLDDDGDLDLLVTRWMLPPVALRNDGAPPFVDISEAMGFDDIDGRRWVGSALGDLDRDGDLDLFLAAYGPRPNDAFAGTNEFEVGDPSLLLIREPTGFVASSMPMPIAVTGSHTFGGVFVDVDGDHWPELAVINDFGWARPSQILWNTRGTLTVDPDDEAGFAIPFAGMGLAIADLNDDGRPDWLQSSWNETSLLISQDKTYFDEAQSRSILPHLEEDGSYGQSFGWGTQLVDVDLDADLDAFITYGFWGDWAGFAKQPDGLFLQDEQGLFADVATEHGLANEGAGRGVVAGDLNGDGYPDLMVRHPREGFTVHTSRCGEGRALEIALKQLERVNPFAVGAEVTLSTDVGVQRRWVLGGTHNLFSAGPNQVAFGLGAATAVTELRVAWPDGEVSVFQDVPTGGRIRIERAPPSDEQSGE